MFLSDSTNSALFHLILISHLRMFHSHRNSIQTLKSSAQMTQRSSMCFCDMFSCEVVKISSFSQLATLKNLIIFQCNIVSSKPILVPQLSSFISYCHSFANKQPCSLVSNIKIKKWFLFSSRS